MAHVSMLPHAGERSARRVVRFAPHAVEVGRTGATIRVALRFVAAGQFGDPCFTAVLRTDRADAVVSDDLNHRTETEACWTIYLPPGEEGRPLTLHAVLAGFGWTGPRGDALVDGEWTVLGEVV